MMKKFHKSRKFSQHARFGRNVDNDGDIDMDNGSRSRIPIRNRQLNNRMMKPNSSKSGPKQINMKAAEQRLWQRITIPNGRRLSQEFILRELTARCEVPFKPMNFYFDVNNAVFFVKEALVARSLRKLSDTILTPLDTKMRILSGVCEMPLVTSITDTMEALIKTAMSSRYDTAEKFLDLANFESDQFLADKNYSFALCRNNIAMCVVNIITDHIPEVVGIDLSRNGMYSVSCLAPLAVRCKELRVLKLTGNKIKHVRDLDSLRGLPLTEASFAGCPFTFQYKEVDDYVSAIRDRFPRVVTLDMKKLPPPIIFDLEEERIIVPRSMPSYMPDDTVRPLIVGFVEQYFACFDSADRSPLLDAYHEAALFSLSATCLINSKNQKERQRLDYSEQNRNLLRPHTEEEKRRLLLKGRLNVLDYFKRYESTQHDPSSFVLDLSLMSPTMMIFHLTGVFREKKPDGTPRPNLRSFQRTFVVVPQGQGLAIVNEEWFITLATERQSRAYSEPSPSRPPSPVATDTMLIETSREQILANFMRMTQMNSKYATDCLEQHAWSPEAAYSVFLQLKQTNMLPPEAFQ